MSLRFIYGRAGSGKTKFCLNAIKKRIEEDSNRPLIYLVPDQFSFEAEKQLLKIIGDKSNIKANVFGFSRMAYRVFNEVGGITRQHINKSGKSMLLYNIIQKHKGNLKFFSKSCKKQGFISNISDILAEFKRYNIYPLDLINNIDYVEDEILTEKLKDLSLIYEEFEEKLHENYIDSEDNLTFLSKAIKESKMFDEAEIWIDEFAVFTPKQYDILIEILKKAYRVNITLSMDYSNHKNVQDNMDIFTLIKSTEDKLIKIIQDENIKLEKPISLKCNPCDRFKDNLELQHLESNFYTFPYKEFKNKTNNIKIIKCLNKYVEIDEIAKNILGLVRDKNLRFKDIAIVTGDLNGYENVVKAIFDNYDIPYFIDKKREINNNPIIILILSAIELLSKNWSYESVFRYIKTGLLDIKTEDIDLLENYILSNGIRGNTWTKLEDWEYKLPLYKDINEDEEKQILNKINNIRYKIIYPLTKLQDDIKKSSSVKDLCESLYDFLCYINLSDKIQNMIIDFKNKNQIEKANEYNQIWNIVIDLLDQLVEVLGNEKINFKDFYKILQTGFSECEIGLIPSTLDQVIVSSVNRLRSNFISAMYIIGVNDGIFPAVSKEDGVLNDDDRVTLKEKGLEVSKDTKTSIFEEQYLVYKTLTTPNKYLNISYPISDIDGKTLRPSIIISRLKKVFPNINEKSDVIKDTKTEFENVSSIAPTFNYLISKLRLESENEKINPLWSDVYKWYENNKEWSQKLENLINGFDYSNQGDMIDSKKIRNLYGRPLKLSVSKIEKFSKCPFAYFVQYGLRAKDRKTYKLEYPDLGILMHEVLKEFSQKLQRENLSWNDIDINWAEEQIDKLVENQLNQKEASILNSSKRYKHIAYNVKNILKRSISVIGEQIKRGNFNPTYYEVGFGQDRNNPICVKLHSGEEIELIGRIDRVDLLLKDGVNYVRIIDYKSGTKEFKLSDVYYGLELQLLIYLDAVLQQMFKEKNMEAEAGGILYFKLDNPIIKSNENLTKEEVEKDILKEMKLKGLILKYIDILKDMDKLIASTSDIIKAGITKTGSVSKVSSVATKEEFDTLRKFVKWKIANICENMLEGDISIYPYEKKDTKSCDYCIYSPICKFDLDIKDNEFRSLKDLKDEDVWNKINKDLKENEL